MREVGCMDIRRYFDVLYRELEQKETERDGSHGEGQPFYLQRGTIDQVLG